MTLSFTTDWPGLVTWPNATTREPGWIQKERESEIFNNYYQCLLQSAFLYHQMFGLSYFPHEKYAHVYPKGENSISPYSSNIKLWTLHGSFYIVSCNSLYISWWVFFLYPENYKVKRTQVICFLHNQYKMVKQEQDNNQCSHSAKESKKDTELTVIYSPLPWIRSMFLGQASILFPGKVLQFSVLCGPQI